MTLSRVLSTAEERAFVALNSETGTTAQGETLKEDLANLREATSLYLEEFPLSKGRGVFLTIFEVTERV